MTPTIENQMLKVRGHELKIIPPINHKMKTAKHDSSTKNENDE